MIDDNTKQHMWNSLRQYINDNCIVRVPNDEPLLPGKKPGTEYAWQFYMRRGLFNSTFLRYVGILYWSHFAEVYRKQPFQITGLETGSTPLLAGLSMTASLFDIDVNVFSIRAQRKTYGLKNVFEGIVLPHLPVMVVDDLSNSKDTIKKATEICTSEGIDVLNDVFTVVHKSIDVTEQQPFTPIRSVTTDGVTYNHLFIANNFDLSYEMYQIKKLSNKQ